MAAEGGQFVRFLFLKLDARWRRLSAAVRAAQKRELVEAVRDCRTRLLLRTFSLVGTRGDADLLFWQIADDLDAFQQFQTALQATRLGAHLDVAHSFLGLVRRSPYEFHDDHGRAPRVEVRPQDARFLFVYPFTKTRAWWALPAARRRALMEEHIRTGRRYPGVRLNTVYSFGLDDQEFVLAFEGDDPGDFLDLVLALRETGASAYTSRDTPVFTCLQMSLWDALDALGGAPAAPVAGRAQADGAVAVATLAELPDRGGKRVYLDGEAIALFRVAERVYAVSDRCSHGRASLSEGTADAGNCRLHCPWHGGVFDLSTGRVVGGPPRSPIATFPVRIDGDRILVG
jgi:chlorite dismutase/nitrite reductase/ring-hydroxylating ferredoxin subunit